jgi:hypothetical protein
MTVKGWRWMEHGGDDGDEAMYDGDDGYDAKLQLKPVTEHGGGT